MQYPTKIHILINKSIPDYILISEERMVDNREMLPTPWKAVDTFETGNTEQILDMIEGEISYEKSFDETIYLKRTKDGIYLHRSNRQYVEEMLEGVETQA